MWDNAGWNALGTRVRRCAPLSERRVRFVSPTYVGVCGVAHVCAVCVVGRQGLVG